MLKRLFPWAVRDNIQKAATVIQQSPRFDLEVIEKQIKQAVDDGTIPSYDQAVDELKERYQPKGKIDLRKTSQDHMFYYQSFGYIKDLASRQDDIPEIDAPNFDLYVDRLWAHEPILAGAVYSMSAKMTALNWQVTGIRTNAMALAQLLSRANYSTDGYDWGGFISSAAQDFYTTNKGTFWETAKIGNPIYGKLADIAHIDSLACELTGNSKYPVVYRSDVTGQFLKFKPGQYIHYASMPSPRENRFGAGICAVARALRAAKLLMGLHDYDAEKLSNLPPEGVAAVTGLTVEEFRTAIQLWQAQREQKNSLTFPQVLWLIGSQPNIQVKLDFIGFSQLPESFDRDDIVTHYINTLALDFGVDVREFWPVSTSSLGTAAESEIQHMKAKGKGPGEFISLTERKINGESQEDVHFEFDTQDINEDLQAAQVAKSWVEAYMPLLTGVPSGGGGGISPDGQPIQPKMEPVIPKEAVLRILADKGVIPNSVVGDDREVILDTDVHIKHNVNSAPASCFTWKNGYLIEQRLPPIIVSGHARTQSKVPDAEVLKDTANNNQDDADKLSWELIDYYKEEPKRDIKGEPIPVREVTRGAAITTRAIRDELELWRSISQLESYAVEEDEEDKYIKKVTKR